MDPIKNPFSPGAGSPPPELVGRDAVLEEARILLGRVKLGRSEKSMLLTGLRGVGKTVLLCEIERLAKEAQYQTIFMEAHEDKPLGPLIIPHLRNLLYELERTSAIGDKVKRGLRVLRSFISGINVKISDISFGVELIPEKGSADSGDLEIDLPNLLVAIAEAAEERKIAIALFIDEIQYFSQKELSALVMAMHKLQQKRLPFVLFGAGLPILPALAGDSKSYAERLFNFPEIGALSKRDAVRALKEPAEASGVAFNLDALNEIFRLTKGYPYFVQEWGYQSWNLAEKSPITIDVVKKATSAVTKRLDVSFFRVRFDRLTPSEKTFLRAMAEVNLERPSAANVAAQLKMKASSMGPLRAKLIKKGVIYSPAYGDIAFTVPLFGEFLLRTMK